jgi:hypothetical protein
MFPQLYAQQQQVAGLGDCVAPLPPAPPLSVRDLNDVQDFMDRINFANWTLAEPIRKSTLCLYAKYVQMRVFSRRKRYDFMACAIYEACSQEGVPISLHELQTATDVRMGSVVRIQRSIADVCIDADSERALPRSLLIRYGYYMGLERGEIGILLEGLNYLYGWGDKPGRILAAALVVYFKRCTRRTSLRINHICTTLRVSYSPVRVLAAKLESDFGRFLSKLFLPALPSDDVAAEIAAAADASSVNGPPT